MFSVPGQACVLSVLLPSLVFWPTVIRANPSGEKLIQGNVEFSRSGDTLNVLQSSDKAIIEWQDFSIGKLERTLFEQPGSSAAALNRVTGSSASQIEGLLQANGRIWLINQNGILVGPNGTVDVGGLLMSTLDVSNSAFLGGGDVSLNGASTQGVVNLGRITATQGGEIILAGHTVRNEGQIGAVDGRVVIAAGNEVVINSGVAGNVFVTNRAPGNGTGVENTGMIEGANVSLAGHGNSYAMAIMNSGSIRAKQAERIGGRVQLTATGGASIVNTGVVDASGLTAGGEIQIQAGTGAVQNSGTLDVSSSGGIGGNVTVQGGQIAFQDGSTIRANGTSGGGVSVAGEAIRSGVLSRVEANGTVGNGGGIRMGATGLVQSEGAMLASGAIGGGSITLTGRDLIVTNTSTLGTSGQNLGGSIVLSALDSIHLDGTLESLGDAIGGSVLVSANNVLMGQTAVVDASGATGGTVQANATDQLLVAGQIRAAGTDGIGGTVQLNGGDVTVATTGRVDATGSEAGGAVTVAAVNEAMIMGSIDASSSHGVGGFIAVTGEEVELSPTALLDASGETGGGNVYAGGGFQGRDARFRNSEKTTVAPGAVIRADGANGAGGQVVLWSDGETDFQGTISARGGGTGNGGLVEVSGRDQLSFAGDVDAGAIGSGTAGTLLLDPANVTIGTGVGPGGVEIANLITALNTSNVVVHTTNPALTQAGDVTFAANADLLYDSANSLSIFANSNILVGGRIVNRGTGNINLVAGWNDGGANVFGTTNPGTPAGPINYEQILAGNFGTWGAAARSIHLNPAADQRVLVGSAAGETNLFAGNLIIDTGNADGEYTQIGYRPDGLNSAPISGDINISTQQHLIVTGSAANTGKYVQIGHGGRNTVAQVVNGGLAGDINVDLGGVLLGKASNAEGWLQIGHGGRLLTTDIAGDISVSAIHVSLEAGATNDSWVQIGHGGRDVRGNFSGSIDVESLLADVQLKGAGAPEINNQDRTYAMIGHGGINSDHVSALPTHAANVIDYEGIQQRLDALGNPLWINPVTGLVDTLQDAGDVAYRHGHSGDITVTAAGSVLMTAPGGNDGYAQIGHGGRVTAGDHTGDITVAAGGSVVFDRFVSATNLDRGARSFVQVGHGGSESSGGSSGDIKVTAALGGIQMHAGRSSSFAQIGHGGRLNVDGGTNTRAANFAQGTLSGDIDVRAFDDIVFRSGFGRGDQSYSQLGHGGFQAYAMAGEGHHGDIRVVSTEGNIDFYAGQDSLRPGQTALEPNRSDNYTMIGHGGRQARGDHWGEIDVSAGINPGAGPGGTDIVTNANSTIRMEATGGWQAIQDPDTTNDFTNNNENYNGGADAAQTGGRNFAMIGHGGHDSDHRSDDGSAERVEVNSGSQGLGMGIHGPTGSSDITVKAGGNIDLFAAQLAHQGPLPNNSLNVLNPALGLPALVQRADDAFAQIGHGGMETQVRTADPLNGYAGNISVTAVNGAVRLWASDFERGLEPTESMRPSGTGTYTFTVPGPSADTDRGYSQIGHGGGRAISPRYEGNIAVTAGQTGGLGVELRGGNMFDTYALIGHGGSDEITGGTGGIFDQAHILKGAINVTSVGDIELQAGSRTSAFAQIGHGGSVFEGLFSTVTGDISVRSTAGDLRVLGGTLATSDANGIDVRNGDFSWAQVGHGGYRNEMHIDGQIDVNVAGDISLLGGTMRYDWAKIGHGGADFNGGANTVGSSFRGDVNVISGGAVNLAGGRPAGIADFAGVVDPEGDASFPLDFYPADFGSATSPGDFSSFAQIGHGGDLIGADNSRGASYDGNILVSANSDVSLAAGDASYAFALIGHGGTKLSSSKAATGDVTVLSGGDVLIHGGERHPGNTTVNFDAIQNFAQIGHHLQPGNVAVALRGASANGNVSVAALGDIELLAGSGNGAHAMIGNGTGVSLLRTAADAFTVGSFTGDVTVVSQGDLRMVAGSIAPTGAGYAFAQIGNGGAQVQGDQSGSIDVRVGENLTMTAGNGANAYTKIGHGDRLTTDPALSHFGFWGGEISVAVGDDATLSGALIGHVGAGSAALDLSSPVTFGVSRNNPFGNGHGTLTTSAAFGVQTSFAPGFAGEMRLYIPSPTNNHLGAGTLLNRRAYVVPTSTSLAANQFEPYPDFQYRYVQGLPVGSFQGTGPTPLPGSNYHLYYAGDTVGTRVEPTVVGPPGPGTGGSAGSGSSFFALARRGVLPLDFLSLPNFGLRNPSGPASAPIDLEAFLLNAFNASDTTRFENELSRELIGDRPGNLRENGLAGDDGTFVVESDYPGGEEDAAQRRRRARQSTGTVSTLPFRVYGIGELFSVSIEDLPGVELQEDSGASTIDQPFEPMGETPVFP